MLGTAIDAVRSPTFNDRDSYNEFQALRASKRVRHRDIPALTRGYRYWHRARFASQAQLPHLQSIIIETERDHRGLRGRFGGWRVQTRAKGVQVCFRTTDQGQKLAFDVKNSGASVLRTEAISPFWCLDKYEEYWGSWLVHFHSHDMMYSSLAD